MTEQKFIKVRATSRETANLDDTNEVQFYLNTSLIKLILLGGEIHLIDNGNDARDGFLWCDKLRFEDIRIHEYVNFDDFLSKCAFG